MLVFLYFLAGIGLNIVKAKKFIYPSEMYMPKLSGIRAVTTKHLDSISYNIFSGSIDSIKFSSNMISLSPSGNTITMSSTSKYPDDRSYYGMILIEPSKYSSNAIVFGGIGSGGVYGDFWKYYIQEDFWRTLDINLQEPSYDFAFTAFPFAEFNVTLIYIVGGINNMNMFVASMYECLINGYEYYNNVEGSYEGNYDGYCYYYNDYTNCTGTGLAGAQLVNSDGVLYLFSGYYLEDLENEENSYNFFLGLCTLVLFEDNWHSISLSNPFGGYANGGSCLYNNRIFYFFGSTYNKWGMEYSEKIYVLDLTNIELGWFAWVIECPENLECARDSFGISCDDYIATIIGGKTKNGISNTYFTINMINFEVSFKNIPENFPSPRAFGTLTQSATKLLLFGGKNSETIFNDVWEYSLNGNMELGTWNLLSDLGSAPEPRHGHAAATQGIYTVFVGGQTFNDLILSDIWLLNSGSKTWTEIIPSETSEKKIPILTRSCAMLDLPKLYFIGGRSYSGANFNLWEYDLSTNNLLLLYDNKKDVGTFGHACKLIKKYRKVLIHTFYGLKNTLNELYCSIREIDITDKKNITVKIYQERSIDINCRGNFGFSHNGEIMVIAGGEIYPRYTMRDAWFIMDNEIYEEITFYDYNSSSNTSERYYLDKPLSASSIVAFSDLIVIFSGYYNGSFSVNSALSSSLYLIYFQSYFKCSAGYYKGERCQPCPKGTYRSFDDEECISCPPGTINLIEGASHKSYCIPCDHNTFYNLTSESCQSCPKNVLCPIGSEEPLNPKDIKQKQYSQPLNFEKPTYGYSLIILGSIFGMTIFVFILLFFTTLIVKVAFSVHEFFRADHIIPVNKTSYEIDKTRISYVGGFFTGIAIILIVFNFGFLIINYIIKNEDESRSLIPLSSLLQDHNYTNNKLTIEIYMYSYRGNCLQKPEIFYNKFQNSRTKAFTESIGENNLTSCTYIIDIEFDELFTIDAFLEISFLDYTSDITLTVSADSGNPGEKSSFTQALTSTEEHIFIGPNPSVFKFSLIPAYYNYKGYFGVPYENLGFRLGAINSPESGSLNILNNIYLFTGFKIKIEFIISEFGITTYRFQSVDPISYAITMLATAPGLISLVRFFLMCFEMIKSKFNRKYAKPVETSVKYIYQNKLKKYADLTQNVSRDDN
ncbi:hypothetical protein SteCoe_9426 [Stentor coeruleus]|uniref:Tyrosine-protein kinase ephrin type A/B receptor-like domain-containing protein n=1 Tax=Stentor coeruleus TaxID=5963 RepID=A0A1R2CHY5_9CILI|nr:hypothetical protein SteCoe_9426 [Stentor coeruleus]